MKLLIKIGITLLLLLGINTIYADGRKVHLQGEVDYPPFTYERDGYLTGFDMDLTNLIFRSKDYDVRYSIDSWNKAYSGVKNGEVDMCGLLAINEQRKKDMLFTKPVLHFYIGIFTRNGYKKVSIENLPKYKVGLGKGQFSEYIYKNKVRANNYRTYNTLGEALEGLNKGEIDVLFENQEVINYLVIHNSLSGKIISQQEFLFPTDVAYGVTKKNSQLVEYINNRLDNLIRSGVYEELYQKYFFDHSEIYKNNQKRNSQILFSTIVIAIIFSFSILRLYIKRLKKKIIGEREFSGSVLKSSEVFVIAFKMDGTIIKFNQYAEDITGCNTKEVLGKLYSSACKDCSKCQKIMSLFEDVNAEGISESKEICIFGDNNNKFTFVFKSAILNNEKDSPENIVFIGVDVSESRELRQKLQNSYEKLAVTHEELVASKEELNHQYDELKLYDNRLQEMAYNDHLTGLPNRMALYENLEERLRKYPDKSKALLFINSDNFKFINDTLGHTYGDILIKDIGKRLSSMFSSDHVVYRLGGDEFIVCLYSYVNIEEVKHCAEQIINGFKKPFNLGNSIFHTTVSIGIALYPEHGICTDELLKCSDIAMYKAKETGKNRSVIYSSNMKNAVNERMLVERCLHTALYNNEFLVYYQPQIDIMTNKICGFEALIRWQSPELGFVSPLRFIRVAEDTHLIIPIGEWVLRSACLFIKDLHKQGYADLTIAVNISMLQLLQDNFVDTVMRVIEFTDLDPKLLELEITESILMESYEAIGGKLNQLRDKGVKIAIDDFGQGYSSLSYLKQLPITTLKIDKIFIDSISEEDSEKSLTDMIVMIGRKMELTVLAEGVETQEQLEYLQKHNCHKIQGYLFSKPLPQDQAEQLVCKGFVQK